MPGAMAKGTLAQSPASRVPKAAARMVAVISAPLSMPVAPRMLGLTKMM